MSLNLSNLHPAKGATKKRKVIGRGGKRGTYSGKGMKGQRARSGVSGLKALGMKQMMLSTPKLRGFKSLNVKTPVVNVSELNAFEDGVIVDIRKMIQMGFIDKREKRVKVLGDGKLSKKLTVIANGYSATAKAAIEAAGGKAEIK
ncbi:MAG: 50S ribosomal protein L15 [Candidatus Buchananbacteria bacterium]|jgi:large subunit ribosomal protein L15